MIYYLISAVFILTIAITSGSIVLATHLKSSYKSDLFSTLIFFQVFYFTFGFYAIWGQLIIKSLFANVITEELLSRITDLMVLLGSPFLIMATIMFVKLAREMSGRKTSNGFIFWFLLVNVVFIVGVGITSFRLQNLNTLTVVRYYFIALNAMYTVLAIYYFLVAGKKTIKFRYTDLVKLSLGLFLLMSLQNSLLLIYDMHVLVALAFILIFYISGSFLPIYLKYAADLSRFILDNEENKSFENFCSRFAISPRETEIIHEICQGLSNQQIADLLFISLQTVKDHTHRIYSKTDCSSRAQLIRMVNEAV